MRRIFTKVYAWVLLILLILRLLTFVWQAGAELDILIHLAVGLFTALVFVPAFHELGHVLFAKINGMQVVYCKCFCLRVYRKDGKTRAGLANPFTPDETQVLPKGSADMKRRAYAYAMGGLIASALILLALVIILLLSWVKGVDMYTLYPWLCYASYLFLLNVLPVEYSTGKTDALIARGILDSAPTEQTMLNVMRIQGELQSGKRYAEVDEEWYFSAPQLSVEEPLYVAILESRYAYYLEKEDNEKAFNCLKRIKEAGEYLSEEEILRLEKNLAYICLLGENDEVLKKAVKANEEYWKSDDVSMKRTLALYMSKCGEKECAELLISQARKLLESYEIDGLRKHEELLLSRIK